MTTRECRPKLDPESTTLPEWNTARWWLSHDVYQRDPARLANFRWRAVRGTYIWCRFHFNGDGMIIEVEEMLDTAAGPHTVR